MAKDNKSKKGLKAVTIFMIFFFIMIAYIVITPFLVIDKVEKRTKLPAHERIK